jgi:hypothetical protein
VQVFDGERAKAVILVILVGTVESVQVAHGIYLVSNVGEPNQLVADAEAVFRRI